MFDSPWFVIPMLLNILMIIAGPILYFAEFNDEICFEMAIVLQKIIRCNLENELTSAGIITLQIIVSILLLPYMTFISICVVIKYILLYVWHWYKYIFRKKEKIE